MKWMGKYIPAISAILLGAVILTFGPSAGYASDEIYMAGAPDEWPFEYFNERDRYYYGVLPGILDKIEKQSGIRVRYVSPTKEDMRLTMAANIQVDAMFTVGLGDRELENAGLVKGARLYSYEEAGEIKDICIAYTESMTDGERKRLEQALSALEPEEIQGLVMWFAKKGEDRERLSLPVRLALLAASCGVLAALILLPYLLSVKKRRIEELAYRDDVTGRDNLAAWKKKFEEQIVDENRQTYAVLYMYTGMDIVSHINGYVEADVAMKLMGDECAAYVDERSEAFARINEFCFVFFIRYTGVEKIKERIRSMHEAITDGLCREKKKYFPELYTGIYRMNNRDKEILKTIQYSEIAMEYARMHSQAYAVYDEFVEHETISGYMMEHEAIHGLMNREFIVYFQPIVELKTGKICGAETLVRWQNPGRGLLKPGEFMKVMKRKQLVGKMNMEVYRQGCYFLESQMKQGNRLKLIFNFTVENVGDELFVSHLESVADQYDISRDQITIQLNQVVEMSQSKLFAGTIRKLRKSGFDILLAGLELDRVFFDYLESGINGIKLRPELIRRTDAEEGRKVVKSVVKLCRDLNLNVLCVGVEKKEQANWLKSIGCELASGFYYYYPVSPEVFRELITSQEAACTVTQ